MSITEGRQCEILFHQMAYKIIHLLIFCLPIAYQGIPQTVGVVLQEDPALRGQRPGADQVFVGPLMGKPIVIDARFLAGNSANHHGPDF
jgi:hypothetical protein